ncbi:MAG TPA: aminomethyl-transferring glycine dehydrogenase [Candidatus Marinimicrobia bacterium]|nr:aminomethyl-transferring glycine dehydrogenase [Candidatus Neomarinimicrobiota bacterium]HIB02924.1 aminomethyl-transferring glycine dehydrogenase [Candidatus Neomarinimicrobiota bacterium]HIB71418.1 aminomethyl-transferring glycine dehydrogenase [Candidatus Neomarinimicrobiota bacterium]HIB95154.1 aminomethyl-transferring glycine dehydrogenase [Candidatus Neomarinimicrobiota bacterium]HIN61483.1 glycine dehydrogenase (aminomethyl-transferring) [Candidatus Neomarinimicrobiota bacterium]
MTTFQTRHLGSSNNEAAEMLAVLGFENREKFIEQVLPQSIRWKNKLTDPSPLSETEVLELLAQIARENRPGKCYIGQGYYNSTTPPVIRRNILENPAWYTAYTPYQAEISQGRLEALLNYQTCVSDLTGLPLANASLLDEATAAAEAMTMFHRAHNKGSVFLVSDNCHPQTVAVIKSRAEPQNVEVKVLPHSDFSFDETVFGALIQYPDTSGAIHHVSDLCKSAHEAGVFVCAATDLMALTLLKPPGEFGVHAAVGNSQRFGVPLGYGGPHAAFFATSENFKRLMPGRIIGVTVDARGNRSLRMALQTREQHIRRDKATSNICTSQVLLAVMASMYAVYHGPEGLKQIAEKIHKNAGILFHSLKKAGLEVTDRPFFDTVRFVPKKGWEAKTTKKGISIREFDDGSVAVSVDETTTGVDVVDLLECFGASLTETEPAPLPGDLTRKSSYMDHPVFNSYHTETELLRYIRHLETKDFSLVDGMIPLGSCTMKLNATAQMESLSQPGFANLHPFAPAEDARGYASLIGDLTNWLCAATGYYDISFQPNSGAQGEYTGLLVIRAAHQDNGNDQRKVCLIPSSAHGTNPASAIMVGMDVIVVNCDDSGNIDKTDLTTKAEEAGDKLAACMITYPSTHGVFEEGIKEICDVIHAHGGLVYLDGANMNAMIGLSRPADLGADVCHLNLHKTFAIPHGGGGPGMGPIGVTEELAPFLPGHPVVECGGDKAIGSVSASPYGSASILTISYAYMALLGAEGLTRSTETAILNANYIAKGLEEYYPVLYRGANGLVAHEFILDLRPFRRSANITEEDVAKRLMDFGFHAPTMSWPVPGTMMVEPTESESKAELDRFVEAMITIRREISDIESGKLDKEDNPLKNAPHTVQMVTDDDWSHPYSRGKAAYPVPGLKQRKFWPAAARVDNAYGDRNLVCTCPPVTAYTELS